MANLGRGHTSASARAPLALDAGDEPLADLRTPFRRGAWTKFDRLVQPFHGRLGGGRELVPAPDLLFNSDILLPLIAFLAGIVVVLYRSRFVRTDITGGRLAQATSHE
ncbi:MAG: hypothetical protein HC834_09340 [Rhodospirillales bacterium]|nr:hypothetical protein [Rhodospirillales bacterium]